MKSLLECNIVIINNEELSDCLGGHLPRRLRVLLLLRPYERLLEALRVQLRTEVKVTSAFVRNSVTNLTFMFLDFSVEISSGERCMRRECEMTILALDLDPRET